MAKGEYCARHDTYFGNIVPCKYCVEERKREEFANLRTVSYEEWLAEFRPAQPRTETT